MHTNYHFLKHLAPALEEKLSGYRLMACFSQDKDELVLGFARQKKEIYIRCSVTPQFSCLYLTEVFGRARKNSVDLWPETTDLRVLSVKVAKHERALKLELENNFTIVFK